MAISGFPPIEIAPATDFPALTRDRLETLQVNLGYLCNQSCTHCHVAAGPKRTENMDRPTVETVLAFLARGRISVLDLTGGAPEMNPHFRYLVESARKLGVHVIDRCNLTILEEPGYEDMARFLAENRVEITASLPCYLEDNVDRQRGRGVFRASIAALKSLNRLGYGTGSRLKLNLVFNPQGPVLPPPQKELEAAYKQHLREQFDIGFDRLYTLANLPIQRFAHTLAREGRLDEYLALLRAHFDRANLEAVMCRSTLSVDWQGYVYDCDFNQMLHLPQGGGRKHLRDLDPNTFTGAPIAVADHCYGCTAGQGSSCRGALNTPSPSRRGQG
ncbi:arsenosugar biosynthesis radical SAM (seleno)protein ArsS [Methylohalobius crimeensis]|uniref:arsenosugar biosynthesis radical SAM (seleno)protein ArsS n=1 Tax=Methylohalobius crimeensis TaxID=244365 RepID=UPI0003B75CD0|nr:arsenosugar biosynthesis radical SAM (seleno)protein ArsS [Methylohalobius crimeensis]